MLELVAFLAAEAFLAAGLAGAAAADIVAIVGEMGYESEAVLEEWRDGGGRWCRQGITMMMVEREGKGGKEAEDQEMNRRGSFGGGGTRRGANA
ncbi:hypothetical protein BCV70DRAFT_35854 [Testicularia cyperi]|uniref:Uncharacterized protein n=1 Tax=Testicularia cyperi TaxID=1882483 RepID=A0A317XIX3_9BASI|nr:hypothetical protein BCV70DRAFT_35854 [Testicularia cyperi]